MDKSVFRDNVPQIGVQGPLPLVTYTQNVLFPSLKNPELRVLTINETANIHEDVDTPIARQANSVCACCPFSRILDEDQLFVDELHGTTFLNAATSSNRHAMHDADYARELSRLLPLDDPGRALFFLCTTSLPPGVVDFAQPEQYMTFSALTTQVAGTQNGALCFFYAFALDRLCYVAASRNNPTPHTGYLFFIKTLFTAMMTMFRDHFKRDTQYAVICYSVFLLLQTRGVRDIRLPPYDPPTARSRGRKEGPLKSQEYGDLCNPDTAYDFVYSQVLAIRTEQHAMNDLDRRIMQAVTKRTKPTPRNINV